MKQMNVKVFLDTNILVYAYSDTEPDKQATSRKLIAECDTYLSTQVLQELANTLTRKFNNSWQEVQGVVSESCKNNLLHINEKDTVLFASRIADKYGYSFYDSLIVAAALECGCDILYSEDMHHGQIVDNRLRITNPFI